MITIVNGNLCKAKEQIIAHQVNCQGVMNSNIAKSIRENFPEAYSEYIKFYNKEKSKENISQLLGCNQYIIIQRSKKIIVNMFAQDGYGRDKRYTDYDALEMCFMGLARKSRIPIAMPYEIGCEIDSGGDWKKIVYPMIQKIFKGNDVILYKN